MSLVYFVGAGQGPAYVKIGTSCADPSIRLSQLQSACPLRLRVLATVRGDGKLERRLHATFRACHMHGEWFEYRGKLRHFVEHLIAHGDVHKAVADVVIVGSGDEEYERSANAAMWPEIAVEVV